MKTYVMAYFGAAVIAVIAVPLTARLARVIGAMDSPGARKIHAKPIPRIGGLAIAMATAVILLAALLLDSTVGAAFQQNLQKIVVLIAAAGFILSIGLVDDIRGLRARTKLLAELIAAIALCAVGIRIDVLAIEGLFYIRLGWLGWPLTWMWIIGITNAINMIDGIDGLATGISALVCAVIAVFTAYTGQVIMTVLMLSMCGALTGFLFFGFHPAKIFLGDCGSLFLGFTLAAASVLSSAKAPTMVGLALAFLAMGVPIFDSLFSVIRRILERRSPFAPDRGHIHHRLMAMGLRQRHVVLLLYGTTALCGFLGMFMMFTRSTGTLLTFACVLTLLIVIFRMLGVIRVSELFTGAKRSLAIRGRLRQTQCDFEKAQLPLREARSFDQWWDALCEAAAMLRIQRMGLTIPLPEGATKSFRWRLDQSDTEPAKVIQVRFPYDCLNFAPESHVDIEVATSNGLELAGRRAELFGRLLDEYGQGCPWPDFFAPPVASENTPSTKKVA